MRLGEGGFSALDTVNVRLEEEGSLPWTLCQCEAGGGGSLSWTVNVRLEGEAPTALDSR